MNHTSTICQCYIRITGNKERFLILLRCTVISTLIQRLILLVLQVLSFISLKDFIISGSLSSARLLRQTAKNRIKQRASHVIYITIRSLYLHILLIRVHAETDIRRQCPRRRRPCQKISILANDLKTNDRRTLLDILISLRNFLRRQRSSTTRAVRYDLESLIQKTLVPDLL